MTVEIDQSNLLQTYQLLVKEVAKKAAEADRRGDEDRFIALQEELARISAEGAIRTDRAKPSHLRSEWGPSLGINRG